MWVSQSGYNIPNRNIYYNRWNQLASKTKGLLNANRIAPSQDKCDCIKQLSAVA